MSVVAVKIEKDKITIGSDSIIVYGTTQCKDKFSKLNKVNDIIIGDVGEAEEGFLFLSYCKTRRPKSPTVDDVMEFIFDFSEWLHKKIEKRKLENHYIIIFEKKVFKIEGFYVKEVTDYDAIGFGMDFSLSALYLGNSVEESIKAACHLSIYCEEPINLFTIPLKD